MTDTIRYKTLVLGDASVGKSCLMHRICRGKFNDAYSPTVAVDFDILKAPGKYFDTVFNIYDVSGHQEFIHKRQSYYSKADMIWLVYDMTMPDSLKSLAAWCREAKENVDDGCKFIVIENKVENRLMKVDLEDDRKVSREEGRIVSKLMEADFVGTSARTGDGLKELIDATLERCYYSRLKVVK